MIKKHIGGTAILLVWLVLAGCDGDEATSPVASLSGAWYAQQTTDIAWSFSLEELPGDSLRGEGWYGANLLKPSTLEVDGIRDGDDVRLRIERECCAPAEYVGRLVGPDVMEGTAVEEGTGRRIPLTFTRVTFLRGRR